MNVSMPIVRARWCDIGRIADLVTETLSPTALGAWLVPDEQRRPTILAAVARIWTEHALLFGDAFLLADGTAATIWFHRYRPIPPPARYTDRLADACGTHQNVGYVVATRRNDDMITTTMGIVRADELIAALPARAWCRLSAGAGAHGPREYWWARVPVRIGWQPRTGALAARPAQHRHRRGRLLRLLRAPPHPPGRPDPHRRCPMGDRGVLSTGQERSRPRRIPGLRLASLVPHITLSMAAHAWLSVARSLTTKGDPVPATA